MDHYRRTQDWFGRIDIVYHIFNYISNDKPNRILEIGCFEGLSACYWADELLGHPESTLTCVYPFMTIDNNDHSQFLSGPAEENFDLNIKSCKNSEKIDVRKITSDAFFQTNTKMFNFIYIDGCHEPDFIKRDFESSLKCLEKDGIIWCDDYLLNEDTKKTFDSLVDKLTIIHKGYQIGLTI
jgi:predicted O-methyltransferase YrrM